MGQLAIYLQQQFQAHSPRGWQAHAEVKVLSSELRQLLGYSPQVDILLTHESGQRLWIEFEISRADPVANHAKFVTAHLFQPQSPQDAFISMMTPHVAKGKRNLAANMIWVMRHLGMKAYQTPLLPHLPPATIQQLNHLDVLTLRQQQVSVKPEIQRVLTIAEVLGQVDATDIHFVANNMEVRLNVQQWNQEMLTPSGQTAWGKRTVTYFVYDPDTRQFAPSKFCAYVAIPSNLSLPVSGATMTVARYTQIDHDHPIFDGQRARQHLTNHLAMRLVEPIDEVIIHQSFQRWHTQYQASINVHPAGPKFLVPPDWF